MKNIGMYLVVAAVIMYLNHGRNSIAVIVGVVIAAIANELYDRNKKRNAEKPRMMLEPENAGEEHEEMRKACSEMEKPDLDDYSGFLR